jgi:hypothetical protein
MSIKKDIFKQMGDYLMVTLQTYDAELFPNGVFTTEMNLPGLKWFDKQMGQFTNPEMAYAIPLPCILMEYQQFTWQRVGKNQQKGTGSIRFYVYFENYADAFTGSINQELALAFFDFTEQAHIALEGKALLNMAPLMRLTDSEDSAEDMIITSQADYGTIINDASTSTDRNYTMVDPEVVVTKVNITSRPVRPGFVDGFVIE